MRIDAGQTGSSRFTVVHGRTGVELSIIVPVFNEEASLPALFASLSNVLTAMGPSYELLAIDDGSNDGSAAILRGLANDQPHLRVIEFARNYGQTAALMAGFDHAKGDIVVTIDADLQNDPLDIPALVAKVRDGFDVVSGWRVDRKDAALSRRLPSWLANLLISAISGVKLKDYGCTLKAYRR